MKSILFVCLGNICRSPLAEGIARDLIKKNELGIFVNSVGTSDAHIGENPCANSIKVAKQNNVDISNLKANLIDINDFQKFDYIIALDEQNRLDLINIGAKNIKKLGDFGENGADVPDPYFFRGFDGFEKVYNLIHRCTINLLKDITKRETLKI